MSGLLLRGGTVVTLEPASVESRDVEIGPEPRREIDASGCVVMPGLVIAHTHLYSGLARGMPAPEQPTRSFKETLEKVWWSLDTALDAETLRASAEVALLEAALCGATTVIDHHESPSFIEGSLDVLHEAARRVGMNVSLCYGATDRHGPDGARRGLAECERAIAAGLPAVVGLHAGFTVSDATLEGACELVTARDTWLHVHAAEDRCDAESFERLENKGLVGPRTILAHGVRLSQAERERAAEAGAWIIHNPRSNLQNAVGYADARTLGESVALGTDGMDGDLFTEARFAHLRAREEYGPAGAIDAVSLLARGRRLAEELLGPRTDDWIVLDYDPPTPLTEENLAGHVLFGMGARHVRDVIAGGALIVEGRKSTRVDAREVSARAREDASRLWKRMG